MNRTAVLLTALLLAACNREPDVSATNASVAEVAQKVRQAGAGENFVRPGLWDSTFTIEKLEMPGMPPEVAQRISAMGSENSTHNFKKCLTPDDVKQPREDFFAGKNKDCRYDRFTMGNGKIDAVMRCGTDEASQVMQMAGTYSPDSYRLQVSNRLETAAKGAQGAMSMQMSVAARRIGECSGKEG